MTSRPIPPALSRRTFLIAGAAGAATPLLLRLPTAGATPRAFGFPEPDTAAVITRPITFPVVGKVTWTDTFGACRGSGCSRRHEGQDLMGKKLQKLVACVDGKVVSLRHRSDGNSLYLQDADGWYYAYLHINNDTPGTDDAKNPIEWAFADGLAEGDTVTKGQHVAYMGDSGNAESSGPHCHFEIRKPTTKGVWKAQAINPKASLDAAATAKASTPSNFSGATEFAPFASARDLVTRQYRDILGREPGADSLKLYASGLESNQRTPAWLMTSLLDSNENQRTAGAITRLYHAYFNRDPDMGGFNHWVGLVRSGGAAADASEAFARSSEFRRTYGSLSNEAFVGTVYRNVLGRASDENGQAFWVDQLDRKKINRGGLMLKFSESNENQTKLNDRVLVFLMNAQMLGVAPTAPLVAIRQKQLDTDSITIEKLVDGIRLSRDYAERVA